MSLASNGYCDSFVNKIFTLEDIIRRLTLHNYKLIHNAYSRVSILPVEHEKVAVDVKDIFYLLTVKLGGEGGGQGGKGGRRGGKERK